MTIVGEKSSTGLEPNIAGALAYLSFPVIFVTGIIVLVLEKDSRFVRFHAMQAIITGVAMVVGWVGLQFLGMLPVLGLGVYLLVMPLYGLATLILWILLLLKAFQGEMFKLPMIGDLAEQQINKV